MKPLSVFVLLTSLAVIAATSAKADANVSTVVINPQIGISLSQLSSDPQSAENKYRLGYHFGGYFRFGDKLYLQPGVFWDRMGLKLQTTAEISGDRDFENDISSIQIPVLIGLNLINSEAATIRVNGGGVGSLVTSVSENLLLSKDDFKDIIFAARVGAGVDFLGLTADAGYDFGLTDIFEHDQVFQAGIQENAKLNSWFFSVGLKL